MPENDYKSLKEQLEKSAKSSRLRPSKEFKDVQNALNSVVEQQDMPNGVEQDMEAAQERLRKACETYLKTREGAKSAKGQQRLDIVESIYDLQQKDKEKMAVNKPEAEHTPTVYEKMQKELEASASGRFSRPSKEFKNVLQSLKELNSLNSKPLSEVSASKMQDAYKNLEYACSQYMTGRVDAKTAKGQERFQMINQLSGEASMDSRFVSQAASPEYEAENQGKTWADAVSNTRKQELPKILAKKEEEYQAAKQEKEEKAWWDSAKEVDLGMDHEQDEKAWWDAAEEVDLGFEDEKAPDKMTREPESKRIEIPVRELENQEAAARKPAEREAGPVRQVSAPIREIPSSKPLQRSGSQRSL